MVRSLTGLDGRVNLRGNFGWLMDLLTKFGFKLPTPWLRACCNAGFTSIDSEELDKLFAYLRFCLEQVCADMEMESLLRALDGEYVLPGPGGDPIRNPGVLPSGKNIHALDPQAIPTRAAVAAAKGVVDKLIERQKEEQGTWPETIACVLWGTDNIKTYGESLAQILWFIGVRPVPDSLGRVNKLELIPLEELGRPRIDVVVNCSGVFRDLFINQMALIDQGVKMAAEAEEPLEQNFVRKHSLEQAEKDGTSLRDAACRVFSNASGSYSSNVNLAVENSTWEEEGELQEMIFPRLAFKADNPGEMNQKREVFESAMKTADVTFQNLDSAEISLTDVSHYFDSDPTNLIKGLRDDGKAPTSYIADTTTANAQVRSLSETIRLDSRTKLLNPKWYEGMLDSGYEGVREVAKRLNFTLGWSATSGAVDNFVYEEANETFINDPGCASVFNSTPSPPHCGHSAGSQRSWVLGNLRRKHPAAAGALSRGGRHIKASPEFNPGNGNVDQGSMPVSLEACSPWSRLFYLEPSWHRSLQRVSRSARPVHCKRLAAQRS